MYWLQLVWMWLLPDTQDILIRGQARLIIVTCLCLAFICLLLIFTWRLSGDLQVETVYASAVFCVILAGIVILTRAGQVRPAGWLLVGLLAGLTSLDVWVFGVSTPSGAASIIPIILAALGLGMGAGLGIALLISAVVWTSAVGEATGRCQPKLPTRPSHLTFNAPTLTVVFFTTAVMAGAWHQYITRILVDGGA